MTSDLIHALAISGSILVAIVILIVIVSFVTVRRGDVAMAEDARTHRGPGYR